MKIFTKFFLARLKFAISNKMLQQYTEKGLTFNEAILEMAKIHNIDPQYLQGPEKENIAS